MELTVYCLQKTIYCWCIIVKEDILAYSFQDLFRVDPLDGKIYVKSPLDSKKTSIVSYAISVLDITPTPNQEGRGTAIINIKPFNTEPPVFGSFISPIYIDEEQPIGSVIITLIATDNNGIREFQIIEQPDNFFTISASTGSLYFPFY